MHTIAALLCELKNEFALHALIGLECEFYVQPALDDVLLNELALQLVASHSLFDKLEREDGDGQLEFSLRYTKNTAELVQQFISVKRFVAEQYPFVSFSPTPYDQQPASGLHVHLHLETEQGVRVFFKNDQLMSAPLKHSIAGLLARMPDAAKKLITNYEGKARIGSGAIDVPNTISWGTNNRSCAIRLPDAAHDKKHIEYRLAGADVDAVLAIEQMLKGVLYGLREQPALPEPIYGNAHDGQYDLESLL